ncbi:dead end protein 1 isoform X1 [Paralichthys olivaceus]|uniref:dead end protein 1 isoform X1 n=1 Tax=Paralichthys olivaceus TaxID=8255 RepID=UPI0037536ED0
MRVWAQGLVRSEGCHCPIMGPIQMQPRGDREASQNPAMEEEVMEAAQSQRYPRNVFLRYFCGPWPLTDPLHNVIWRYVPSSDIFFSPITSASYQVLNFEPVPALETWLKTTNTQLIQVNGQRKYGGPPEVWNGPIPGANCEVFISQIPRDVYEDRLIPLFSSVGPLWEFRLMMNFSGQNRGFAYAKYSSSGLAAEAICLLDGYMLEQGSCIKVRLSIEKRHLCIEDLPATTRQEELLEVLRVLTEGVQKVSLTAGPGIEGVSAIVAFSSHYTASMAKKMLVEVFKKQFALNISIVWHPDESLSPNKPPKSPLASPLKPPCHILKSPQPSVPPPHLAHHSPTPPSFCRAVGGPTTFSHPHCPHHFTFSSSQGDRVPVESPVMLLSKVCEVTGVGQPRYEMSYSHTGRNGFLYFDYTVCIPRITTPFKGLVMTLPGPTASTVQEEAGQAAAQQVLKRIYNNQ